MRVRFEWDAETPIELPVNYQAVLQGIIYRNLQNECGYSEFVHEEGHQYGQRQFRMFCFSKMMGCSRFYDKKLVFTGPLSFEVSSPDVYLIRTLAENIESRGLDLLQYHIPEVRVLLSDYEVETESILVDTLSPITVYSTYPESGKTRYYAPGEPEFSMAVCHNFHRKYEAYYGMPADADVWIEPWNVEARDKCVTRYKGFYITGYGGSYRLRGKRKHLNFLYQAGVGGKNSQGFGMIEERE